MIYSPCSSGHVSKSVKWRLYHLGREQKIAQVAIDLKHLVVLQSTQSSATSGWQNTSPVCKRIISWTYVLKAHRKDIHLTHVYPWSGSCYKIDSTSESESHSVMFDSLQSHGLHSWNSWSQNTGVGSCSLLQGIFPTQGLNPSLWHCRKILY